MSIGRLATVLSHHWLLVAALTAALLVGVAAVTYSTVPSYRASALLQVQAPMESDGTVSLQDTLTARERAVTIVALGNTALLAQRAAKAIGALSGVGTCDFSQSGQSEFLFATCTGTSSTEVARAANGYAAALQRLLEQQRQARITELTNVYRKQVQMLHSQGVPATDYPAPPVYPAYRELELVDGAVAPRTPFAPRPLRALAIAFVLGLLLNVGLAFLIEHVQNRARTPEELQSALGLPVLVAIPKLGRAAAGGPPPVSSVVRLARGEPRTVAGGDA